MALTLLTVTADAAERPALPSCEAGDVRLELAADVPAKVPTLCITPELTSVDGHQEARIPGHVSPGVA
jgi:hypothetical protein